MAGRFQKVVVAIALVAALLMITLSDAGIAAVADVALGYGFGIASIVIALLLIQFLWARLRQPSGENPTAWYRAYAAQIRWCDIIASLLALTVTVSCFTVYKGTVVGSGGYGFDAMFIAWDRAIFAGNDPWVLTHSVLPSAFGTKVIDILYHPTFLPMVIGFIVCIATQAKTALRYTYMTAYLTSFVIIGMISASALHSAGPIYDGALFGDGQTFAPLIARLAEQNAEAGPFSAVFAQDYLLRLNEEGVTGFGGGISAMPSMHIVLAFLWVFAAYHLHRALGVIVTLYALVIWFGSVHLGWHYFVDGLVGLIMLALIWYVAGRTFGLYGRA
ncbi:MAG: phosphatase PAP2 family protein [Pseudomonadota bacterium]